MKRTTLEMLALARITRNAHGYDFLAIPRRNDATREIYNACGSIRVATRDTETGTINSDQWILEKLGAVKVGEWVTHRLLQKVNNLERGRETQWIKISENLWESQK
ncbi:MAG: hypothetical protein ACEQSD_12225 [Flavobacteriales bacterium]